MQINEIHFDVYQIEFPAERKNEHQKQKTEIS